MGIVVCVVMLLGLIQLLFKSKVDSAKFATTIACLLIALGFWNAAWYGLQHLSQFWGQAALVSGISMVLTAFIIAGEAQLPLRSDKVYQVLLPIRLLVFSVLAVSFLLYAITLARLNLGMSIIS